LLAPTSQMRAVRELEPPSVDEGFAAVDQVPFARTPVAGRVGSGVFVAAAALRQPGWERAVAQGDGAAPHLVFDWSPDGAVVDLAADVRAPRRRGRRPGRGGACARIRAARRAAGCRPPLPGLPLAFARAHGVDPARSVLVGTVAAHRTLATALGARYVRGLTARPKATWRQEARRFRPCPGTGPGHGPSGPFVARVCAPANGSTTALAP